MVKQFLLSGNGIRTIQIRLAKSLIFSANLFEVSPIATCRDSKRAQIRLEPLSG